MVHFKVGEEHSYGLLQDISCSGLNYMANNGDSPIGNLIPNLNVGSQISVIYLSPDAKLEQKCRQSEMGLVAPKGEKPKASAEEETKGSHDSLASFTTAKSELALTDESAVTSILTLNEGDLSGASPAILRASDSGKDLVKVSGGVKKSKSQQFFTSLDSADTIYKNKKAKIAVPKSLISKTVSGSSGWFTSYRTSFLDIAALENVQREHYFLTFNSSRSIVTLDLESSQVGAYILSKMLTSIAYSLSIIGQELCHLSRFSKDTRW